MTDCNQKEVEFAQCGCGREPGWESNGIIFRVRCYRCYHSTGSYPNLRDAVLEWNRLHSYSYYNRKETT